MAVQFTPRRAGSRLLLGVLVLLAVVVGASRGAVLPDRARLRRRGRTRDRTRLPKSTTTETVTGEDVRVVHLPLRPAGPPAPSRRSGARTWLAAHRTSLIVVTLLLIATGVVQAVGMSRYPAPIHDEGTYTAQAWALQHWHRLAHYTYFYDHPPFGWMVMALWTWITGAFDRASTAVAAGREVALVSQLVSVALVYLLARRLGLRRTFATAAVLMFAFSPLALVYHRIIYLDNLATPWVLAAFVLALSPRRHLGATIASAFCFTLAVLSKETTLILLPALVYQLWQHADARTRRLSVALFMTMFLMTVAVYPLYAALKGELFPGHGHVSLLSSTVWQLLGRKSSGSIFVGGSQANDLLASWMHFDPWLLFAGAVFLPAAFVVRRLRPVAVVGATIALTLLRPGYLPIPFVILPLTFAPIVLAGVGDEVWSRARRAWAWHRHEPGRRGLRLFVPTAAIVSLVALTGAAAPAWGLRDARVLDRNGTAPFVAAEHWAVHNLSQNSLVVTEDSFWLDFVKDGWPAHDVFWFEKLDSDPAVKRRLRLGWRSVDYLVVTSSVRITLQRQPMPTVEALLDHSHVIASFGPGRGVVQIRAVDKSASP